MLFILCLTLRRLEWGGWALGVRAESGISNEVGGPHEGVVLTWFAQEVTASDVNTGHAHHLQLTQSL